ncbi:hypothetical protein BKA57DRAFT_443219 [Linnemannia elongata]|nr:hypothetical protein BKA57DRAFT_443219 [Linnemannia elongata]
MSFTPPNTQGIRSININNSTSSPPHPTEVVYVDIYTDRITREKFILWEDVRLAFHNALHIRHQARVIPFMKDDDFNTFEQNENELTFLANTIAIPILSALG